MSDTSTYSDDRADRIAAATKKADPGSNHGAGMDGDDASAADKNQTESEPRND